MWETDSSYITTIPLSSSLPTMPPIKIKHLPKPSKLSLLISIYPIRVMFHRL